jgi:hypothetical protein
MRSGPAQRQCRIHAPITELTQARTDETRSGVAAGKPRPGTSFFEPINTYCFFVTSATREGRQTPRDSLESGSVTIRVYGFSRGRAKIPRQDPALDRPALTKQ